MDECNRVNRSYDALTETPDLPERVFFALRDQSVEQLADELSQLQALDLLPFVVDSIVSQKGFAAAGDAMQSVERVLEAEWRVPPDLRKHLPVSFTMRLMGHAVFIRSNAFKR